jgi:hypothetical protein
VLVSFAVLSHASNMLSLLSVPTLLLPAQKCVLSINRLLGYVFFMVFGLENFSPYRVLVNATK